MADVAAIEDALAVAGKGPAFLPPFATSPLGTMGIELELMVLGRLTYDLLPAAPDILRLLDMQKKDWVATPPPTPFKSGTSSAFIRRRAIASRRKNSATWPSCLPCSACMCTSACPMPTQIPAPVSPVRCARWWRTARVASEMFEQAPAPGSAP